MRSPASDDGRSESQSGEEDAVANLVVVIHIGLRPRVAIALSSALRVLRMRIIDHLEASTGAYRPPGQVDILPVEEVVGRQAAQRRPQLGAHGEARTAEPRLHFIARTTVPARAHASIRQTEVVASQPAGAIRCSDSRCRDHERITMDRLHEAAEGPPRRSTRRGSTSRSPTRPAVMRARRRR